VPTSAAATSNRCGHPTAGVAVSSLDLTIERVDDTNAHTSQVHDDLIADKGLAFTYGQHIESRDCLLLRWAMLAPSAASSPNCSSA
jgi:hypothetical protein